MKDDDPSDKYKMARDLGMMTTIPMLMAVSPLVGYFIGRTLDSWLGTGPWLSAVMLVLGFAAGIREVVRIIRKSTRP